MSSAPGALPLLVLVTVTTALTACDGGSAPATPPSDGPAQEASAAGSPGEAGITPAPSPESGAAGESESAEQAEPEGWVEEGFRPIYDFVDNRHLFHQIDTGILVDFGHPAGHKYIQGRWRSPWQAGRHEGDRNVAWTDGVGATFRVPLTEVPGDMELVLRMRTTSDSQRMDVFLNSDERLVTVDDPPTEWGEVRVRLPADQLQVGENKFRVHFTRSERFEDLGRTAGGFDWARIQPLGADPPESHKDGAFQVVERADGSRALAAPAYGTLAIYMTVPDEARLRLWLAAEAATAPAAIRVLRDGEAPSVLWQGEASATPTPIEVDLSGLAGQVVRLELAGTGPMTDAMLHWIEPILAVPERPARELDESLRPRRILVWLIDALRVDHFAVYTPETRVAAPNLVDFADRCVAFRRTTIQGNSSLPGSGTIHSGTYPTVHQLVEGGRRLPRSLTLLAEPFDEAGWDTGLFSSNGYVADRRGFDRGYDEYRNLIHEPGRPDSEYLWPIVRDWLADRSEDTPWLAFINTIDPHVPYDPPEDILARYFEGTYRGRIRPRATGILLDELGDEELTGTDLEYLTALYDGEITYNDVWFGHAVDDMTELGLLDDTLVVITADHGEQFFEHGRGGHGIGVWEEEMHIPLMFCHPPSLGESRWVDVEVEMVDLVDTLLDLSGLEPPESSQGISLVPLMLDPTPVMNRPAFSYHQDYLRGMRVGRWKYHLRTGDNDNLYDLDESPLEGDDHRADHPIAHRYMRDVMAFHLAFDEEWHKRDWGFPNNHTGTFADLLDGGVW
jgi:arylsulfatase A-like enzyme